jgi:type IV secretion system protein VirB9
MKTWSFTASALSLLLSPAFASAGSAGDPRLRDVPYDPNAVVTVPVKRGVVTLVVLGADEAISEVGSGLGADCARPDASWCVAAQPGGRTLFVKPKSNASAANTLAVVTDRRVHNLRFVVLADGDARAPVYRLTVRAPAQLLPATHPTPRASSPLPPLPVAPLPTPPEQVVAERLQARPQVVNTQYSLAEGRGSEDIVPTLVFDDGRFTYLRFPGNREVPAVFHVLGDGSETLVNTRMEDDLLIVDRVSRRLVLRAGSAVVGLWNEAFDLEGLPPGHGTTVPGVERILKPDQTAAAAGAKGVTP